MNGTVIAKMIPETDFLGIMKKLSVSLTPTVLSVSLKSENSAPEP